MSAIAIFDSGIGGLSVATEIEVLLPGRPLAYVCDDAFFPYGTRTEEVLVERVVSVASAFAVRVRPEILVLACNTASTVALPKLRERLAIPVVGVVPAVKPAASLSVRRIIGVLGTEATARRRYTRELIDRFAGDCAVISVGSAELVRLAEAHVDGPPPPADAIAAVLAPFFDRQAAEQPDVIVLACTHFPMLRPALQAAVPAGVQLIDSGRAIAERVLSLAGDCGGEKTPHRSVCFTGDGTSRAVFERRGFQVEARLEIIA